MSGFKLQRGSGDGAERVITGVEGVLIRLPLVAPMVSFYLFPRLCRAGNYSRIGIATSAVQ